MSSTITELRRLAMGLLARREHSRTELFHKLKGRAETMESLELVLSQLEDDRLLSDERFAESFVRSRISRGQGPVIIRQMLRQKGVDEALVTLQFDALATDWLQQARQVTDRKFGSAPPADVREKVRRMRYLQYRGFDAETIRCVIEGRRGSDT